MTKTSTVLLSSLLLFACGKKDAGPSAPAAKPAEAAAASPAKPAPEALVKLIQAADTCKEEACADPEEALDKGIENLSIDDFRAALPGAKKSSVRSTLIRAVHDKLGDKDLEAFVTAANACKTEEDCQAQSDLSVATDGLTPDRYRALAKLATSNDAKGTLLSSLKLPLDPSLVPDMAAMATDDTWGRVARRALGSAENEAALTKLVALLDDHSKTDTVHGDVPELLAKYPNNAIVKAAVPKLEAMARGDKQGVGREAAAAALVKIEGKAAIPLLTDMAKKDDWDHTRSTATDLLKQVQ